MDGDLLGMGGDTRAARAETPRGDDPVSEAVAQLQSMFPSVDAAVIEMVYEDMAGGDLEKAIEALLSITDDAVDQPGATEQATADEMIAMQMLQQMMNEEDASKADADKVFAKIQSDTERKENFKKAPANVKAAFVRNLEKMKAKAQGLGKKGSTDASDRTYSRGNYGSLLDDDDPNMKV